MKNRCPRKFSQLSSNDRRELRNFRRFLRLWPTRGFDMLQSDRWREYLHMTEDEARAYIQAIVDKG
jgi:hypothetical protein